MGCDIHLTIEHRPVVGWQRTDAEVRALQRRLQAEPGDPALMAQLRAYELHGDAWEIACFEFTDRGDETSERARKVIVQHPERVHTPKPDSYYNYYSVVPGGVCETGRHYELFYWLTGTVRGRQQTRSIVAAPRGLPGDLSAYTAELVSEPTSRCGCCTRARSSAAGRSRSSSSSTGR